MIDFNQWGPIIESEPLTLTLVHNLFGVATQALDQAELAQSYTAGAGAFQANTDSSGLVSARDNLTYTALAISTHNNDPVTAEDAEPFRNAVRNALQNFNAQEEGASTQAEALKDVPQDTLEAIQNVPGTVGTAIGSTASAITGAAGSLTASTLLAFLKGLVKDPIGLIFVGAVGYIVYRHFKK